MTISGKWHNSVPLSYIFCWSLAEAICVELQEGVEWLMLLSQTTNGVKLLFGQSNSALCERTNRISNVNVFNEWWSGPCGLQIDFPLNVRVRRRRSHRTTKHLLLAFIYERAACVGDHYQYPIGFGSLSSCFGSRTVVSCLSYDLISTIYRPEARGLARIWGDIRCSCRIFSIPPSSWIGSSNIYGWFSWSILSSDLMIRANLRMIWERLIRSPTNDLTYVILRGSCN